MKKAIWISFDFGLKGDYQGLYTYLDNLKAVECGQGLAFISYEYNSHSIDSLFNQVRSEILEHVKLSKTDRIYIIWRDETSKKIKGEFVSGSRKQSPWEGYGKLTSSIEPDTGE